MISRKILDIMTIWHDIQKKSGYHRRIYRKFRDIVLYRVDIRKVSVFYPTYIGLISRKFQSNNIVRPTAKSK
jgi:hypothetical protein